MGNTEDARPYPEGREDTLEWNPEHAVLRREAPVVRVHMPYGEDAWLVTRYADVKAVMADSRFSRAAWRDHDEPRTFPFSLDFGLVSMDPPEHTALRKLLNGAFTDRRMHDLRGQISTIAHSVVADVMEVGPPADLVREYAEPISARTICALLGVPVDDWPRFRNWMSAVFNSYDQTQADRLHEYLVELVGPRRSSPGEDLVSTLAASELPEQQVAGVVMMLLGAGYDSTAGHITNCLHALLRRPDHTRQLRDHPHLIPKAVEELLRFLPTSATPFFARYATEDIQLGDIAVRAGEAVLCEGVSANMDNAVFVDPERLDFTADRAPQLGFGYGIHRCLGAQLARAELQISVATLLTAFPPHLRITVPDDELPWRRGQLGRGVSALPVIW